MKKTVLLICAALIGTNVKAGANPRLDADNSEVKSNQAAALAYLVTTGAVGIADDGRLNIKNSLLNDLRASGAIEKTDIINASAICLENSK